MPHGNSSKSLIIADLWTGNTKMMLKRKSEWAVDRTALSSSGLNSSMRQKLGQLFNLQAVKDAHAENVTAWAHVHNTDSSFFGLC
jgi:hypothetical protein